MTSLWPLVALGEVMTHAGAPREHAVALEFA